MAAKKSGAKKVKIRDMKAKKNPKAGRITNVRIAPGAPSSSLTQTL